MPAQAGIQSKSSVQSTQLIRLDASLRWYDDNNSQCLVKFGIADQLRAMHASI